MCTVDAKQTLTARLGQIAKHYDSYSHAIILRYDAQ
jgi:hypothetical protein